MLERNGTPNLSFTNEVGINQLVADEVSPNEANFGQDKPKPRKVA
jgi:hypothetical protein